MALCSPLLYLTEAIPLPGCWAGTDPSCFSATRMKLKKKESICNLLFEILNCAGFLFFSCGEGKMLAVSGVDICHCGATLCFTTPLACAAGEHVSLTGQQQCSLSLLHRKGTSPNLPSGSPPRSCRATQTEITAKTREMSQQHGSSQCATPGLRCHKNI